MKDEGFDELRYAWNKAAQSEEYMTKWVLDKKLSTPVQDSATQLVALLKALLFAFKDPSICIHPYICIYASMH